MQARFSGHQPHDRSLGNSHAVVTASALAEAAEKTHESFLLAASVDCPIGIGFGIDPHVGSALAANRGYQYCEQYNREMLDFVRSNASIRVVVLSSRWTNWRLGEPGSAAEAPVDIRLRDARGTAGSPSEKQADFRSRFRSSIASSYRRRKGRLDRWTGARTLFSHTEGAFRGAPWVGSYRS